MFNELLIIRSIGINNSFLIAIFYLFIIGYAQNFKLKFNFDWKILLLFLISSLISYKYISLYLTDLDISYEPVTKRSQYNPLFYSTLYSINSLLFYTLLKKIFNNKFIIFFGTIIFLSSPFQLYFLGPSLLRDYIKILFFLIILINIIDLLKVDHFKEIFNSTIILSSFIGISLLFRQDLLSLIPIIIVTIFFTKTDYIKKFLAIFIFLLFLFPIFIELSNFKYGSGISSLIVSLSSDLGVIYKFEHIKSLGPFEDFYNILPACFEFGCNQLTLFVSYAILNLDFIFLRFVFSFFELVKIPFHYNYYPYNDGIFYFLNLKGFLLGFGYYILFLLPIFFILNSKFYIQNIKKNFLFLLWFIYLSFVVSFQFFGKHFFYLEVFSIILFSHIINEILKLIKKL